MMQAIVEEEVLARPNSVTSAAVVSPPDVAKEEEKMYVALENNAKEGTSVLLYALKNRPPGMKVVLLHVHRPSQTIPFMGAWFKPNQLSNHQVKIYRQQERDNVDTLMNDYMLICKKLQAQCEKLVCDKDDIARGLIETIEKNKITKLVMGAAAEKHYSRKMKEPKSKIARAVLQDAVQHCKIWFVCKGHLIFVRQPTLDGALTASPSYGSVQSDSNASSSYYSSYSSDSTDDAYVQRLESYGSFSQRELAGRFAAVEPSVASITANRLDAGDISDAQARMCSSRSSLSTKDEDIQTHENKETTQLEDELGNSPSFNDLQLHLSKSLKEISKLRDDFHEETLKCHDAEIRLLIAHQRARELELKHYQELKLRKDIEESLQREKLDVEKLKIQRDELLNKLKTVNEQIQARKIRIVEYDKAIKDVEQEIAEGRHAVSEIRGQVKGLERKQDIAVKKVDELDHMTEEPSCKGSDSNVFSEFSYLELEQATSNFAASFKIGKGGYGSVYKGFLHHTLVAIKFLNPDGMQGKSEFQQEVNILSRVRHPNLVTLIGACRAESALVYEFLSNGSLEDHLRPKKNGTALTWQHRTRISHEVCTALAFLHSTRPHGVVHGDLKPANILLDDNMVSKLGDFGISRLLTASFHHTTPKGTLSYMDPQFLSTGELTPQSDVYSFGIVLLRLVTGMAAAGVVKAVREAVDKGRLHEIVDQAAGQWPFLQVQQLAHLGLRCCAPERSQRPDLIHDVLRVLKSLKNAASTTVYPRSPYQSPDECDVPRYFMCPIFQEIMTDPQVAADGYTYEAQAIKGWLERHDTSPMTNLQLPHCHLIPNFHLRSAIEDWLQQHH